MTSSTMFLMLCGAALLILLVIYNGLIAKKNAIDNAFSAIDAQLKLRFDLIPNLVESVKNYMTHERKTLEELTTLRTKLFSSSTTMTEKLKIDDAVTGALKGIMVAVENYPNLKANESFNNLMGSLTEIEQQISAARRAFNATVTEYNNAIEMFPSSLVAFFMRLKRKDVLSIPESERTAPNVGKMFKS